MERVIRNPGPDIRLVRELITRFEICHFKYRLHILKIKKSILDLQPAVDPENIGAYHIRTGKAAALKDKTGRSLSGLNYIRAFRKWLGDEPGDDDGQDARELDLLVADRLGRRNPQKERLVKLLIARMMWDWESYGKLEHNEKHKELALQCCRMDTCHYNYPENLDILIKGIGELKPAENFEGCGSFNSEIRDNIKKELNDLNKLYRSFSAVDSPSDAELAKTWLYACMLKTLKEQAGLTIPIQFG